MTAVRVYASDCVVVAAALETPRMFCAIWVEPAAPPATERDISLVVAGLLLVRGGDGQQTAEPEPDDVAGFDAFMQRYVAALPVQRAAVEHVGIGSRRAGPWTARTETTHLPSPRSSRHESPPKKTFCWRSASPRGPRAH